MLTSSLILLYTMSQDGCRRVRHHGFVPLTNEEGTACVSTDLPGETPHFLQKAFSWASLTYLGLEIDFIFIIFKGGNVKARSRILFIELYQSLYIIHCEPQQVTLSKTQKASGSQVGA